MVAQVKINLSQEDQSTLQRNIQSRSASRRLIERSKIILLAAKNISNYKISKQLKLHRATVALWRNRFVDKGILCLEKELPRGANHGGKNTQAQSIIRSQIINKTVEESPTDASHWSTRSLAREMGISHSLVHRVWREVGLKPHLFKTFKISNDPNFEDKLTDVVGLYMSPPENAVVFCVDEKSSIQALDRTQPGLPIKPGRCGTMTHDYKRHGTSTLFAALNVLTGEVIGQCMKKHRHQEFLSFLKTIDKQTPKDLDLHIIVDNYATHKHQKVKTWIKNKKRIKLHFIPTSSSWLNLVERFFGLLTEKQLRRGVHTSVKQLEESIMRFIEITNKNKKPFTWTKSAEQILMKVERARQALI